jgi:site-specific DNA-methyltransferase (adenine-specific)
MITLMQGDCLERMKDIPSGSIDAVITDPPYGTVACRWDNVIPFEPMWEQLTRIIKPNGAIVLFSSQPFTSALVMSNPRMFKYEWIWDKKIPSGMSYARFQPMRQHENIVVFCAGKTKYNPQMVLRDTPIKGGGMSKGETTNNQKLVALKKTYTHKNPTTILVYDKVRKGSLHPTQKPISLLEYLVLTYTDEGETVLDFTMGSGTCGVACNKLNRNFIGIELDEVYFQIAKERIGE